jgi:hypothetical protein
MIDVILSYVICYASAFALGFCTALTLVFVYVKLAQIS